MKRKGGDPKGCFTALTYTPMFEILKNRLSGALAIQADSRASSYLSITGFPDLGSLITEDGECTTEFRTRLNRGQAIGNITAENMEKSQHTDFNEDTTNECARCGL